MKNLKLRNSKILMLIGGIIISGSIMAQTISLGPNRSGFNPGDTIHVPIVISCTNINNATFCINYDPEVLYPYWDVSTDQYYTTIYTLFGSSYDNNPIYDPNIAIYYQFWTLNAGVNKTYANQKLVELVFVYTGGSTTLHLRRSPDANPVCQFYNASATSIPIIGYTDKTISGNSGTYDLHSVTSGGPFIWQDPAAWQESKVPSKAANVYITGNEVDLYDVNAPPFPLIPERCNNLTIYNVGQLTSPASTDVKVGGNVLIQSDASGSGSFVDLGNSLTVTGTTSVQRYMSGNWTVGIPTSSTTFHEISSPVSGGTINTFLGDILNKWDEPTSAWVALVLPLSTPLTVGTGYATAPHSPGGVKTFTGGHLNTGNLPINGLTRTGAVWTGYNLLGNPYPCALLFDSTAFSMTNLDPRIWVWDPVLGNYRIANSLNLPRTLTGNIVPPEDGFFVHVTSGTGSMIIPNAKRLHSTQAFYKDAFANALFLTVNGNGYGDMMCVYFNPNAASSYDLQYDALKLTGSQGAPQLYSILDDNTDVTINGLPSISSNNTINLGFKVGVAGNNTITVSGMESFANGTTIYLKDNQAGQMINLVNHPVYTFDATPSDPVQRFTLLFNPVGISEHNQYSINIYSYDKDIFVNIPMTMQGNIVVYDLVGNQIISKPITANSLNKIPISNAGGYYLVKVIGDSGITTGKVYIR